MALPDQRLALSPVQPEKGLKIRGTEKQKATVNFFRGNDPAKWRRDLPTYAGVVYENLWSGIDWHVAGKGKTLKYEFVVKPGADPRQIKLAYQGVERLVLSDAGELVVKLRSGELRDAKPTVYQEKGGEKIPVEARFALINARIYGFALGPYDPQLPLIIDPSLYFATYLGGDSWDFPDDMVIDGSGNIYVTGYTTSTDFATVGAYDTSQNGSDDIFVAKLASNGQSLTWCTYIGGSSGDGGKAIAVDSSGRAYVAGYSYSTDFPTASAYQGSKGGSGTTTRDAVVFKLNASGSSLLYSTYLGGTTTAHDSAHGIAVDNNGIAWVAGKAASTDFPTTAGVYDTSWNGGTDFFVAKLDTAQSGSSSLSWSTYVGGTNPDEMDWLKGGMAVDGSGNVYVTGEAKAGFPTTVGAYDTSYNDTGSSWDVVVFKLNSSGTSLVYSTYLGGTAIDVPFGLTLDSSNQAWVTGYTSSSGFPTTVGAYDRTRKASAYSAFVAALNADGTGLVFGTFLEGASGYYDYGYDIAIDSTGRIHVAGSTAPATGSSAFPTTADAYDRTTNGSDDWFYTRFNAAGSSLVYSSVFGTSGQDTCKAMAIDATGDIVYLAGSMASGFTTQSAYRSSGTSYEGLVIKIGPNTAPVANAGSDQSNIPEGATVTLNGSGSSDADGDSLTYSWSCTVNCTGVSLSSSTAVSPTFTAPDVSLNTAITLSLTVNDGIANSSADTVNINVNARPLANNQTVTTNEDTAVSITLSASDPNSETLTYAVVTWPTQGSLSTPFTGSPARITTYTPNANYNGADSFTFWVSDGLQESNVATVSISIGAGNDPPTANAGSDQLNVSPGTTVTLNGTGSSDPDGDSLTYSWTQTSGPTATLSSTTAAQPTFTARRAGTLVFSLIVNDGTIGSNPDSITVTVTNVAPVVNAGSDDNCEPGSTVQLAGSATDTNNDTLTYGWALVSGPGVTFSNMAIANPTVTVPMYYPLGTMITLRLTVSDGVGGSSSDLVVLTYGAKAPTGSLGGSFTSDGVFNFGSNSFTAYSSDTMSYSWNVVSCTDPNATFDSSSTDKPSLTAIKVGTCQVRVCVTDGSSQQNCFTHTVTTPNYVPKITKIKGEIRSELRPGEVIDIDTLGISSVSDSNQDTITTTWAVNSGPATLQVSNGKIDCRNYPCPRGTYTFQQVSVDPNGGTAHETVNFIFPNNAPAKPTLKESHFKGADVVLQGDSVKFRNFSKDVSLRDVVFGDDDGDNLAYTWTLNKPVGLKKSDGAFGFVRAGSGLLDLKARLPGTYTLTVEVSDGYGGVTSKNITVVIPLPEVDDLPIEVKSRTPVGSTEEVEGTVDSPVFPIVSVNGVEAEVTLVAEGTSTLSAMTLETGDFKGQTTSGTDETYDSYSFKASGVPSSSELDIEVATDVDGEVVALVSKQFTDSSSTGTGSSDGGGGDSDSPSSGGCGLSQSSSPTAQSGPSSTKPAATGGGYSGGTLSAMTAEETTTSPSGDISLDESSVKKSDQKESFSRGRTPSIVAVKEGETASTKGDSPNGVSPKGSFKQPSAPFSEGFSGGTTTVAMAAKGSKTPSAVTLSATTDSERSLKPAVLLLLALGLLVLGLFSLSVRRD